MLEFVIENFKKRDNEKKIIEALPKLDKIVFNLVCDLLQSSFDELEIKIDNMVSDQVFDLEDDINNTIKKKFDDLEWDKRNK